MSDRVRVGVVGLGMWGQNHPLVYDDYDRAELVVVCDRDEQKARGVAARYGCDWTTDVGEIARGDVSAVSVATPDFAHAEPVRALLEGGKHVLVEKPLTTSVEEARGLAEAARRAGVIDMVDFHLRWDPQWTLVKDTVEQGGIGKPVMGYIRLSDAIDVAENWLAWAGRSGPQWFLFPHTMDLMRWIIDEEPIEVYAGGHRGVLEAKGVDCWDAIQAMVRFPSATVTFETSWIVPNSQPSVLDCHMSLYGKTGKVDYDADYSGLAISTDQHSYPWVPVGQRNRYGKLDHYLYEPMRYFVDCVAEGSRPQCTFADGLVNVAMIEAAVRSLESGRPVALSELL